MRIALLVFLLTFLPGLPLVAEVRGDFLSLNILEKGDLDHGFAWYYAPEPTYYFGDSADWRFENTFSFANHSTLEWFVLQYYGLTINLDFSKESVYAGLGVGYFMYSWFLINAANFVKVQAKLEKSSGQFQAVVLNYEYVFLNVGLHLGGELAFPDTGRSRFLVGIGLHI
jgi:hypothetical protein